jgi:hypothetical protein
MPASLPPVADVVPRLSVRDPDGWLRVAAWVVVIAASLQILMFPFGRDQGIYALLGEGILRGQVPYRDLWDFKPPGIFFVYAFAQGIFGKSMLAPRLVEVLGLVAIVLSSVRLGDTFFGSRTAGVLGGAVAALVHAQLEFWHSGQPETFGGALTFLGLVLTATDGKRARKPLRFLAIGALFGCAALLKPPLGGGALVCAAYLAKREQQIAGSARAGVRAVLVIVAGILVPIALVLLWFWARGGLSALVWTMKDFTPGYTALGWEGQRAPAMFYYALLESFFKFSALAAFGVIAAIATTPMHLREREGVFLVLGIIAVHVTGIAMQGKFFAYHYGGTLPLIAFLAGLGLYKLWRRCLSGGTGGVLAFMAFVTVCVAMRQAVTDLPQDFWERTAIRMRHLVSSHRNRDELESELGTVADVSLSADRAVARELRSRTRSGSSVLVWGFEPVIYWLADRKPATRFIYDVPQRTSWERERARYDLMRDLGASKPAAIVVQHNDVFPMVTGNTLDSARELAGFGALHALVQSEYEHVTTIEDFDLYLRRSGGSASVEKR